MTAVIAVISMLLMFTLGAGGKFKDKEKFLELVIVELVLFAVIV
jgi:hypothetical protein